MNPTHVRPRRWIRLVTWGCGLVVVALLVKFVLHLMLPRTDPGSGEHLDLQLKSGPFHTLYYGGGSTPSAILVIGTGDGGWSYWEERLARHAVADGMAVGSWDCRKFADSRQFGQADLVEGFRGVAAAVRERSGADDDCPVLYAGWSTGAEWAVAAAASPDRDPCLAGVLAAAPGQRSRYGITKSDLLGFPPKGAGSFALQSLVPALDGVAIVMFSAGLDPLDDTHWLDALGPLAPHQLVRIPGVLHDMDGAGDDFLREFSKAAAWCMAQQPKEDE